MDETSVELKIARIKEALDYHHTVLRNIRIFSLFLKFISIIIAVELCYNAVHRSYLCFLALTFITAVIFIITFLAVFKDLLHLREGFNEVAGIIDSISKRLGRDCEENKEIGKHIEEIKYNKIIFPSLIKQMTWNDRCEGLILLSSIVCFGLDELDDASDYNLLVKLMLLVLSLIISALQYLFLIKRTQEHKELRVRFEKLIPLSYNGTCKDDSKDSGHYAVKGTGDDKLQQILAEERTRISSHPSKETDEEINEQITKQDSNSIYSGSESNEISNEGFKKADKNLETVNGEEKRKIQYTEEQAREFNYSLKAKNNENGIQTEKNDGNETTLKMRNIGCIETVNDERDDQERNQICHMMEDKTRHRMKTEEDSDGEATNETFIRTDESLETMSEKEKKEEKHREKQAGESNYSLEDKNNEEEIKIEKDGGNEKSLKMRDNESKETANEERRDDQKRHQSHLLTENKTRHRVEAEEVSDNESANNEFIRNDKSLESMSEEEEREEKHREENMNQSYSLEANGSGNKIQIEKASGNKSSLRNNYEESSVDCVDSIRKKGQCEENGNRLMDTNNVFLSQSFESTVISSSSGNSKGYEKENDCSRNAKYSTDANMTVLGSSKTEVTESGHTVEDFKYENLSREKSEGKEDVLMVLNGKDDQNSTQNAENATQEDISLKQSAECLEISNANEFMATVNPELPANANEFMETVNPELPANANKFMEAVNPDLPANANEFMEIVNPELPANANEFTETVNPELPANANEFMETVNPELPATCDDIKSTEHVKKETNERMVSESAVNSECDNGNSEITHGAGIYTNNKSNEVIDSRNNANYRGEEVNKIKVSTENMSSKKEPGVADPSNHNVQQKRNRKKGKNKNRKRNKSKKDKNLSNANDSQSTQDDQFLETADSKVATTDKEKKELTVTSSCDQFLSSTTCDSNLGIKTVKSDYETKKIVGCSEELTFNSDETLRSSDDKNDGKGICIQNDHDSATEINGNHEQVNFICVLENGNNYSHQQQGKECNAQRAPPQSIQERATLKESSVTQNQNSDAKITTDISVKTEGVTSDVRHFQEEQSNHNSDNAHRKEPKNSKAFILHSEGTPRTSDMNEYEKYIEIHNDSDPDKENLQPNALDCNKEKLQTNVHSSCEVNLKTNVLEFDEKNFQTNAEPEVRSGRELKKPAHCSETDNNDLQSQVRKNEIETHRIFPERIGKMTISEEDQSAPEDQHESNKSLEMSSEVTEESTGDLRLLKDGEKFLDVVNKISIDRNEHADKEDIHNSEASTLHNENSLGSPEDEKDVMSTNNQKDNGSEKKKLQYNIDLDAAENRKQTSTLGTKNKKLQAGDQEISAHEENSVNNGNMTRSGGELTATKDQNFDTDKSPEASSVSAERVNPYVRPFKKEQSTYGNGCLYKNEIENLGVFIPDNQKLLTQLDDTSCISETESSDMQSAKQEGESNLDSENDESSNGDNSQNNAASNVVQDEQYDSTRGWEQEDLSSTLETESSKITKKKYKINTHSKSFQSTREVTRLEEQSTTKDQSTEIEKTTETLSISAKGATSDERPLEDEQSTGDSECLDNKGKENSVEFTSVSEKYPRPLQSENGETSTNIQNGKDFLKDKIQHNIVSEVSDDRKEHELSRFSESECSEIRSSKKEDEINAQSELSQNTKEIANSEEEPSTAKNESTETNKSTETSPVSTEGTACNERNLEAEQSIGPRECLDKKYKENLVAFATDRGKSEDPLESENDKTSKDIYNGHRSSKENIELNDVSEISEDREKDESSRISETERSEIRSSKKEDEINAQSELSQNTKEIANSEEEPSTAKDESTETNKSTETSPVSAEGTTCNERNLEEEQSTGRRECLGKKDKENSVALTTDRGISEDPLDSGNDKTSKAIHNGHGSLKDNIKHNDGHRDCLDKKEKGNSVAFTTDKRKSADPLGSESDKTNKNIHNDHGSLKDNIEPNDVSEVSEDRKKYKSSYISETDCSEIRSAKRENEINAQCGLSQNAKEIANLEEQPATKDHSTEAIKSTETSSINGEGVTTDERHLQKEHSTDIDESLDKESTENSVEKFSWPLVREKDEMSKEDIRNLLHLTNQRNWSKESSAEVEGGTQVAETREFSESSFPLKVKGEGTYKITNLDRTCYKKEEKERHCTLERKSDKPPEILEKFFDVAKAFKEYNCQHRILKNIRYYQMFLKFLSTIIALTMCISVIESRFFELSLLVLAIIILCLLNFVTLIRDSRIQIQKYKTRNNKFDFQAQLVDGYCRQNNIDISFLDNVKLISKGKNTKYKAKFSFKKFLLFAVTEEITFISNSLGYITYTLGNDYVSISAVRILLIFSFVISVTEWLIKRESHYGYQERIALEESFEVFTNLCIEQTKSSQNVKTSAKEEDERVSAFGCRIQVHEKEGYERSIRSSEKNQDLLGTEGPPEDWNEMYETVPNSAKMYLNQSDSNTSQLNSEGEIFERENLTSKQDLKIFSRIPRQSISDMVYHEIVKYAGGLCALVFKDILSSYSKLSRPERTKETEKISGLYDIKDEEKFQSETDCDLTGKNILVKDDVEMQSLYTFLSDSEEKVIHYETAQIMFGVEKATQCEARQSNINEEKTVECETDQPGVSEEKSIQCETVESSVNEKKVVECETAQSVSEKKAIQWGKEQLSVSEETSINCETYQSRDSEEKVIQSVTSQSSASEEKAVQWEDLQPTVREGKAVQCDATQSRHKEGSSVVCEVEELNISEGKGERFAVEHLNASGEFTYSHQINNSFTEKNRENKVLSLNAYEFGCETVRDPRSMSELYETHYLENDDSVKKNNSVKNETENQKFNITEDNKRDAQVSTDSFNVFESVGVSDKYIIYDESEKLFLGNAPEILNEIQKLEETEIWDESDDESIQIDLKNNIGEVRSNSVRSLMSVLSTLCQNLRQKISRQHILETDEVSNHQNKSKQNTESRTPKNLESEITGSYLDERNQTVDQDSETNFPYEPLDEHERINDAPKSKVDLLGYGNRVKNDDNYPSEVLPINTDSLENKDLKDTDTTKGNGSLNDTFETIYSSREIDFGKNGTSGTIKSLINEDFKTQEYREINSEVKKANDYSGSLGKSLDSYTDTENEVTNLMNTENDKFSVKVASTNIIKEAETGLKCVTEIAPSSETCADKYTNESIDDNSDRDGNLNRPKCNDYTSNDEKTGKGSKGFEVDSSSGYLKTQLLDSSGDVSDGNIKDEKLQSHVIEKSQIMNENEEGSSFNEGSYTTCNGLTDNQGETFDSVSFPNSAEKKTVSLDNLASNRNQSLKQIRTDVIPNSNFMKLKHGKLILDMHVDKTGDFSFSYSSAQVITRDKIITNFRLGASRLKGESTANINRR